MNRVQFVLSFKRWLVALTLLALAVLIGRSDWWLPDRVCDAVFLGTIAVWFARRAYRADARAATEDTL